MVGMPATVWLPVIGVLFIRLLTIIAVLLSVLLHAVSPVITAQPIMMVASIPKNLFLIKLIIKML